MLHKLVFKAGYLLKRPGVISNYNDYQQAQWLPYEQLKDRQEKQLVTIIKFAYENIPYYSKLLSTLGLAPGDVKTIEDLEKIPILTKETIKDNWHNFIPKNINKLKFLNSSTTGSTGKPLQYRMSTGDWERGLGLLFLGWGYAGYELADKVVSILPHSYPPTLQTKLHNAFRCLVMNVQSYSTFNMDPDSLQRYFTSINSWRPHFIKSSPSAMAIFAQCVRDNNLELGFHLTAVFTNQEMLFNGQRKVIQEVFKAPVFNQYGLNDGGISAFECREHCGVHIDTERAILETVDNEGKQIINREGKILATSLYNYAQPFIRYDTGDAGIISNTECACGRKTALLTGCLGRTSEALKLGGITISNPGFGGMLGKLDIEQFQIIQDNSCSITFRIVKGKTYKEEDERFIEKCMRDLLGKPSITVNIKFDYVNFIPTTKTGKHKICHK
jgi:phenylacetate-CoA ligase